MGRASNRKKRRFFGGYEQMEVHEPVEPYASAIDKASEDDRLWFEAHPGIDQRVRNYVAGELRDYVPPVSYKILVRQVRPGFRLRSAIPPDIALLIEQTGVFIFDPMWSDIQDCLASDQTQRRATEPVYL